jgi:hypothetical protein
MGSGGIYKDLQVPEIFDLPIISWINQYGLVQEPIMENWKLRDVFDTIFGYVDFNPDNGIVNSCESPEQQIVANPKFAVLHKNPNFITLEQKPIGFNLENGMKLFFYPKSFQFRRGKRVWWIDKNGDFDPQEHLLTDDWSGPVRLRTILPNNIEMTIYPDYQMGGWDFDLFRNKPDSINYGTLKL